MKHQLTMKHQPSTRKPSEDLQISAEVVEQHVDLEMNRPAPSYMGPAGVFVKSD